MTEYTELLLMDDCLLRVEVTIIII
jgi:hypothetical protein